MPFLAYNTDDPNATAMGYAILANNASVTLGPINTGVASKVAGSCFSDTAGTLFVYQSFDKINYDVVQPTATGQAIVASTPYTIDADVIAPWLQVKFTNSNNTQAHLRIFVRVFGVNRG